ncbi:Co2+/Mg2+ efflux protein ApaG [Neolewinella antarctica]|uniref:ApaG protein n=1 Tax=Neolewinella antarctica TaxID=442734 RepID=A0ABX0XFA2_9BACT|nr:Co2+/Mg2+ efflux protein ApaG [Neolewinella antarctica]NJC28001.1 ApaG protein [Neolewinella antarctica]
MVTLTTNEVKVSAESTFQRQYSEPTNGQYVFSYRIQIENNSARPIRLLARRWEVISATGERRLVEGEGVVGQQPTILPGQSHEYTSWVQFETRIGFMQGNYIMSREDRRGREVLFEVTVPKFAHVAPEALN